MESAPRCLILLRLSVAARRRFGEGRVVVVKAAQGAAQGDVVRGALAALGVPGLEAGAEREAVGMEGRCTDTHCFRT